MQRRIEQPDRHRQPLHRFQDSEKVLALNGQQLFERLRPLVDRRREDHFVDERQAFGLHEHVLRTAETYALRAELARLRGVLGRVGIRPDLHSPQLVGPRQERREPIGQLRRRRNQAQLADDPLGRTFAAKRVTHEMQVSAIVVSYYWHFVDVVWIGLFFTIYIIH